VSWLIIGSAESLPFSQLHQFIEIHERLGSPESFGERSQLGAAVEFLQRKQNRLPVGRSVPTNSKPPRIAQRFAATCRDLSRVLANLIVAAAKPERTPAALG
jgi:hypothetical protein